MGGCDFMNFGTGSDARKVFDSLVEDSRHASGHEYSGEIGMKAGFITVTIPADTALMGYQKVGPDKWENVVISTFPGGRLPTKEEAKGYAEACLRNDDRRFEKWGPAGCIEISFDKPEDALPTGSAKCENCSLLNAPVVKRSKQWIFDDHGGRYDRAAQKTIPCPGSGMFAVAKTVGGKTGIKRRFLFFGIAPS